MKIICLGDSITAGQVRAKDHWIGLAEAELKQEFMNKGIKGDTTGGMLARFDRDVLEQKGRAVFLMGGINDLIAGCRAEHVQPNLMALVHQAWFYKIVPVIGIPILFDTASLPEQWTDFTDFARVLDEACSLRRWLHHFGRVFHTEIVDFESAFEQCAVDERAAYFIDGLHPNERGCRLMADWLIRHIGHYS